jgi:transposase
MYIDKIPNRNSPPTYLIREAYRDKNQKVQKKTIMNVTKMTNTQRQQLLEFLNGLKDNEKIPLKNSSVKIVKSLPHGDVYFISAFIKKILFDKILSSRDSKEQKLVLAMIIYRLVNPCSKRSTFININPKTATSNLFNILKINEEDLRSEDDLYLALDWLFKRKNRIENKLASKHLARGSFILYDVSSSYFEGEQCQIAKRGYSRDKRSDLLQVVYGMICAKDGTPISIDVYPGNTKDSSTLKEQVDKVLDRFKLKDVIFVGDRGMISSKSIGSYLKEHKWITALKHVQIKKLINQIQFNESIYYQFTHNDYPKETLVACLNKDLKKKRQADRESLLVKTEDALKKIQNQNNLEMEELILKVGSVINKYKVKKHFNLEFNNENNSFLFNRDENSILIESKTDGVFIVRTNVSNLNAEEIVAHYKNLSLVESGFKSIKRMDMMVRPIFHRLEDRVRSHIFLCMLAYYVKNEITKVISKNRGDYSFKNSIKSLSTINANLIEIDEIVERFTITTPNEAQAKLFKDAGIEL